MSYAWSGPIRVEVSRPKGEITGIKIFVNGVETEAVYVGDPVQVTVTYRVDAPGRYRVCLATDTKGRSCTRYVEHTMATSFSWDFDWIESAVPGHHKITAELYAEALTNPLDIEEKTYLVMEKEQPPEEGGGGGGGEEWSSEEKTGPSIGSIVTVIAGAGVVATAIMYLIKKIKK